MASRSGGATDASVRTATDGRSVKPVLQVAIPQKNSGPVGGEVLSMLIVAVHAEVPVSRLRTMITAYPTFHRAVDDALNALS